MDSKVLNYLLENRLYHEIHVSEIREFKKCKRAHYLKYVEQWYPKVTQTQLNFGTAIHAALEAYYDPKKWTYDRDVARELAKVKFFEVNEEQRDELKRVLGTQYGEKHEEEFNANAVLGVGMLEHYFSVVSPSFDTKMVPVAVEQSFAVPIIGKNAENLWCTCDRCKKRITDNGSVVIDGESYILTSLPVVLEGKLDLIMKDLSTNKFWINDWKTTKTIVDSHEWLELDEQILAYCWALWSLGYSVAGFRYAELWKYYPQEPRLLDRPYRGCKYSTSHTSPTTYELAKKAFMEGDPQAYAAGKYDQYLNWLRLEGPTFFNAELIRKTAKELDLYSSQLRYVANELITNYNVSNVEDSIHSPNKFGCMYCDFFSICVSVQQREDYKYTLESNFEKKTPYYEDENGDLR